MAKFLNFDELLHSTPVPILIVKRFCATIIFETQIVSSLFDLKQCITYSKIDFIKVLQVIGIQTILFKISNSQVKLEFNNARISIL